MGLIGTIRNRLYRRYQVLSSCVSSWVSCGSLPYGNAIFRNIVELLTDLANDVQWVNKEGDVMRFAEWCAFFERDAKLALWRMYRNGFAVIGFNEISGELRLLDENEYNVSSGMCVTYAEPKSDRWTTCYVLRSDLYRSEGLSDYALCVPFLTFLDNVMNSSNTASEKMGTFIVASPETPNGYPTPVVMSKQDKAAMEETLSKEYGSLSKQKQIMLLPRGMKFETISMEAIDRNLTDKVRLAVLAICDRVKVPSNQVSIIDANSGKTLSNGSELREGDYNKYQSFERLLNCSFVKMASDMGLRLTYTIYNKPTRQ